MVGNALDANGGGSVSGFRSLGRDSLEAASVGTGTWIHLILGNEGKRYVLMGLTGFYCRVSGKEGGRCR